jgi:hypothetical protein
VARRAAPTPVAASVACRKEGKALQRTSQEPLVGVAMRALPVNRGSSASWQVARNSRAMARLAASALCAVTRTRTAANTLKRVAPTLRAVWRWFPILLNRQCVCRVVVWAIRPPAAVVTKWRVGRCPAAPRTARGARVRHCATTTISVHWGRCVMA